MKTALAIAVLAAAVGYATYSVTRTPAAPTAAAAKAPGMPGGRSQWSTGGGGGLFKTPVPAFTIPTPTPDLPPFRYK